MKELRALWNDLEAAEIAVIVALLGCAAIVAYKIYFG